MLIEACCNLLRSFPPGLGYSRGEVQKNISVPTDMVGFIIGRGGETIKMMQVARCLCSCVNAATKLHHFHSSAGTNRVSHPGGEGRACGPERQGKVRRAGGQCRAGMFIVLPGRICINLALVCAYKVQNAESMISDLIEKTRQQRLNSSVEKHCVCD